MTRNVTDAAVMLGAMTGVDSERSGDRRAGRQRLRRLHPVPRTRTRSTARASASGGRAPTTRPSAPKSTRSWTPRSTVLEAAGRHGRRRHQDPDRGRPTARSSRRCSASSRRHRLVPRRRTPEPGYPKTLQDLIDFNDAHPGPRGPAGTPTIFVDSPRRPAVEPIPPAPTAREFATSTAQAAIDDRWRSTTSTRSSRRRTDRPG